MRWSIRPSQDKAWPVKLGDTSVTDLCLVPVSALSGPSSDKYQLCAGGIFPYRLDMRMPVYVFLASASLQRGRAVQLSPWAPSLLKYLAKGSSYVM